MRQTLNTTSVHQSDPSGVLSLGLQAAAQVGAETLFATIRMLPSAMQTGMPLLWQELAESAVQLAWASA